MKILFRLTFSVYLQSVRMNKRLLINTLATAILLLCAECDNRNLSEKSAQLISLFENLDYEFGTLSKSVVLIIPLSNSCSSCKHHSLQFIKNNNIENLFFVPTATSKKVISISLNQYEIQPNDNIIIDGHFLARSYNLVGTTPRIYYLRKDQITYHQEITAVNFDSEMSQAITYLVDWLRLQ